MPNLRNLRRLKDKYSSIVKNQEKMNKKSREVRKQMEAGRISNLVVLIKKMEFPLNQTAILIGALLMAKDEVAKKYAEAINHYVELYNSFIETSGIDINNLDIDFGNSDVLGAVSNDGENSLSADVENNDESGNAADDEKIEDENEDDDSNDGDSTESDDNDENTDKEEAETA